MKSATRMRPSTTTKYPVLWIGSQFVISAGVTLNSATAKPIATTKAKMIAPREISVETSSSVTLLLRRVVGRDGERAEADRERLAQRDHAADHRQPEDPVPRHRRGDRVVDLRDVAVPLAHGDRPRGGSAHHHAFEDGLTSDGRGHTRSGSAAPRGAAGLLEPALEALHTATRVEQLLLPRVEGMAVRADLDVQLWLGGANLELVAAGAANGRQDVLGMDAGLHSSSRIATAVWAATLPPETTATVVPAGSAWTFPASRAAASTRLRRARRQVLRARRGSGIAVDLVLRDEHHLVHQLAADRQRIRAGERSVQPVRDRARLDGDRLACLERDVHRRRKLRLDTDDSHFGRTPLTAVAIPEISPPPPIGTTT